MRPHSLVHPGTPFENAEPSTLLYGAYRRYPRLLMFVLARGVGRSIAARIASPLTGSAAHWELLESLDEMTIHHTAGMSSPENSHSGRRLVDMTATMARENLLLATGDVGGNILGRKAGYELGQADRMC